MYLSKKGLEALKVRCPVCGVNAGQLCRGWGGSAPRDSGMFPPGSPPHLPPMNTITNQPWWVHGVHYGRPPVSHDDFPNGKVIVLPEQAEPHELMRWALASSS